MRKLYGKIMLAMVAMLAMGQNAFAALDLTAVGTSLTGAVTDVQALAVLILGALAGMFVVRKVIKTTNRC